MAAAPAPPAAPGQPVTGRRSGLGWLAAAAVIVVLAAGGAALWFFVLKGRAGSGGLAAGLGAVSEKGDDLPDEKPGPFIIPPSAKPEETPKEAPQPAVKLPSPKVEEPAAKEAPPVIVPPIPKKSAATNGTPSPSLLPPIPKQPEVVKETPSPIIVPTIPKQPEVAEGTPSPSVVPPIPKQPEALKETPRPVIVPPVPKTPEVVVKETPSPVVVPPIAPTREATNEAHLRQLGVACIAYRVVNNAYPKSLADLCGAPILLDKRFLVSPLDANPPALPGGLRCSYESCFAMGMTPHPTRLREARTLPMVWDRMCFVPGKRSVLFFDGHVETVLEEKLAELIIKLEAATRAKP